MESYIAKITYGSLPEMVALRPEDDSTVNLGSCKTAP
jgi:hypothetical protein